MSMVIGSKTMARWFSGAEPSEWPIYGILDKLQDAIVANALIEAESQPYMSDKFKEVSNGLLTAYRELDGFVDEMSELQKGGVTQ